MSGWPSTEDIAEQVARAVARFGKGDDDLDWYVANVDLPGRTSSDYPIDVPSVLLRVTTHNAGHDTQLFDVLVSRYV